MVRLTAAGAGAGAAAAERASKGEAGAGLTGKIEKQAGQRMSDPEADSDGWHCFPHIGQVTLATMGRLLASKGD